MYRWLAVLVLWALPVAAVEYPAAVAPDVARALAALPQAPGGGLFMPAAPTGPETPAAAGPRVRSAAVDPADLAALIAAAPLALDAGGAVAGQPRRMILNLFDDLSVSIVKLSESRSPLGPRVIRAAVTDGGYATFVIEDGTVTADIAAGGREVAVRPAAGGLHRITEAREPSDDDIMRKPPASGIARPGPEKPGLEKPGAGAPAQIKILIIYTREAKANLTSVRATAALMMDTLNAVLTNSQVNAQAVLAGLDQLREAEPAGATSGDYLNRMKANTGDFARVAALRAAAGADIVTLVSAFDEDGSSANSAVCGRGWLNDDLDTAPSLAAEAVYGANVVSTAPTCLPNLASSFAHEVGHNLGASHDRYTEPTLAPGPGFYAAGYVDLAGKFRDTMSYSNKCTANNVSCTRVPYYSSPTLTYNGRPLGIADSQPDAADASRRVAEIAPYAARLHESLAAPAAPVLSLVVSGSGAVTSTPSGIDCGDTCSAAFTAGVPVTLAAVAPAGWGFKEWSGACTGAGACTVTMSTSRTVTAVFLPALRFGPVFSTAQKSSQSFIRLANTGSAAATATVKLWDYSTGAAVGQWTSPPIPAGTAPQYAISTIESGVTAAPKPQYYALAVQTDMIGTTQHVLWKPSDGTLTNLSTCDTGITAGAGQVAGVHSSVLDAPGYPSSVAVNNVSAGAASGLSLGVYDARDGARLGAYAIASLPANAKLVVSMADIEAGARITPTADMFHYIIKIEGTTTATGGTFLQHLVDNRQVGVITDMTTACAFGVAPAALQTIAIRTPGPLYSTAQVSAQSFLRFANTGTAAGSIAVTLRNAATGARYGQWTSPPIPPGAAPQYGISDIETALNISAKPQYYAAMIETQIAGSVAHVLWKPSDSTLTNLSTCEAGVSSNTALAANVHSSLLDTNYPSTVAVNNTGSAAQAFTLGVFDARSGARLGTATTAAIPANGQLLLAVSAIERAINLTPAGALFHYVVKLESGTGFLQHLVNNQARAVITDMTTVCQLPARAVSFTDCAPNIAPRCTAAVGAPTSGQLKQANSWQNFDVALTAGRTYTIDVKGASTNSGTLAQPYIFIYPAGGSSVVAQGGRGGTGNDARLTFTPAATATYVIQVSTYVIADGAGTFVLTVQ